MSSLLSISQYFIIYVGGFIFLASLLGCIIQVIVFTITQNYRKKPCVFYFLVATIHDAGQILAGLGPFMFNSYFSIDINLTSRAWCKMRLFFASSFSVIPFSCVCLATFDQMLITCKMNSVRQWSTMRFARRVCLIIIILWWLHGSCWIFFRDLSPISGLCIYTNNKFYLYAIFFILIILDTIHISAMIVFALLCYRNIRRSIALSRRHIDRQMILVIYLQTIITLISTIPYAIFVAFMFVTTERRTLNSNRDVALSINGITYTLSFITYGSRFYLFLFVSSRFRRTVREQLICLSRNQRVFPS